MVNMDIMTMIMMTEDIKKNIVVLVDICMNDWPMKKDAEHSLQMFTHSK